VNAAATGANNGTSWQDAFVDLRVALETHSTAEIWVARGTYRPSDAADGYQTWQRFRITDHVVLGGFAGTESDVAERDPIANPTILSGDLLGDDGVGSEHTQDNALSVVVLNPGDPAKRTELDGFVLTGAVFAAARFSCDPSCYAAARYELRNCWIINNPGYAAFALNGNARLINCVIQRNGELNRVPAVHAFCDYNSSLYSNSSFELLFCTIIDNPFGATLGGNRSNNAGPHGEPPRSCHGDVIISHCILRGNGPPESALGGDRTVARFSNIEGGFGTETTIIDDDPRFIDRDGADNTPGTLDDDLRLAADSTSLDAGDISAADVATDLAGGPRVLNCRADFGVFEASWFRDCDANGAADGCELIERPGEVDGDGDGVIDACESEPPGEDGNGNTNAGDGENNNTNNGDDGTGGDDNGDGGDGTGDGSAAPDSDGGGAGTFTMPPLCGGVASVLLIGLLVGLGRARINRPQRHA
jgi:hypothetical protein